VSVVVSFVWPRRLQQEGLTGTGRSGGTRWGTAVVPLVREASTLLTTPERAVDFRTAATSQRLHRLFRDASAAFERQLCRLLRAVFDQAWIQQTDIVFVAELWPINKTFAVGAGLANFNSGSATTS
jgi:hypothetical protein